MGTVLREQPAVNALLNGIAAVPTAAHLDELDNLLANAQRDADSVTQTYRKDLFIYAAALAVLLLYVAIKLIRSHTRASWSRPRARRAWPRSQPTYSTMLVTC